MKDDIIRMAREAGFLIDTHSQKYQPNCILSTHGLIDDNLQRFANLAVAAEREACAKVCSEAAIKLFGGKSRVNQIDMHTAGVLQDTAEAIRARGTT